MKKTDKKFVNLHDELTRETIIDVEVDDDCTKTVTRIPIMTPTIGLLTYLFLKTEPENINNYYIFHKSYNHF